MRAVKVKEMGEFGVIDLLAGMATGRRRTGDAPARDSFPIVVDNGDDTAAWRCGRTTELWTTDTAVEGVHFTRRTTPWYDLGWKVMAANISDIASMGGLPLYALITLGLPPDQDVEDLEALYTGMLDIGNEHGVAIVGGDMVRSTTVFVTVGLTGVCEGTPMLRSNASPGELMAVTGFLGSSAGGLDLLMGTGPTDSGAAKHLVRAHRRPTPCVSEGRALATHGVTCAMDISDGLVDDLSKLCRASGVSARVNADKVPVHEALRDMFPDSYLDMALGGGEDYQLLFIAPKTVMESVMGALPSRAAVIGTVLDGPAGEVSVVDSATGQPVPAPRGGWDHFAVPSREAGG